MKLSVVYSSGALSNSNSEASRPNERDASKQSSKAKWRQLPLLQCLFYMIHGYALKQSTLIPPPLSETFTMTFFRDASHWRCGRVPAKPLMS